MQRWRARRRPISSTEPSNISAQVPGSGTTAKDWEGVTFFKGKGCDTCAGSGYKGRAGLYEVMSLSAELRRQILRGASTAELQEQAVKEGMLTLRMDGIVKIRKGVTTLEEVVKETAA